MNPSIHTPRTRPAAAAAAPTQPKEPPRVRHTPAIPAALADVTLIDARTSAATGGMGVSWWLARVAAGEAPKPAIQRPRMTRWRLVDVREFWAAQAATQFNQSGA